MRPVIIFFATGVLAILATACCMRFNDLSAGVSYPVGATVATSNNSFVVEQFQWGNGTWYADGSANVDHQNHARGTGLDINARNVNLNFRLGYPLSKLTLKFGELGGNINIRVNNDFRNIRDLVMLNGATIGGVGIMVNAAQQGANWYGKITLNGTINDFVIGGQELWIDDVCKE